MVVKRHLKSSELEETFGVPLQDGEVVCSDREAPSSPPSVLVVQENTRRQRNRGPAADWTLEFAEAWPRLADPRPGRELADAQLARRLEGKPGPKSPSRQPYRAAPIAVVSPAQPRTDLGFISRRIRLEKRPCTKLS